MPSIAVNLMELPSTKYTVFGWLQRRNWEPWYSLSDRTRGGEEPVILQDFDLVGTERPRGIFWSGVTHAALNAQLRYVFEAGSTGNDVLDNVATPTWNSHHLNDLLRAYNVQALVAGMVERETGLEEHLLAEFRNLIVLHSDHISERLQGFIDQYQNCSPDLEPIPTLTLIEVKHLVSWLSRQDDNMYATVTDDGILALEATIASVGRLFVEVDRSGVVEATIVSADFGITGLDVTTVSDLTSVPVMSLIGGP